jgi:hypothetical protein
LLPNFNRMVEREILSWDFVNSKTSSAPYARICMFGLTLWFPKQWLNTLGLGADDVSREMTYIIALINGDKTLFTCYETAIRENFNRWHRNIMTLTELWPTTTTTATTTTTTPTPTTTTTPPTTTITNDNTRQLNDGSILRFIQHWPCLLVLAAHFGYHLFMRIRKTAKIDYQLRHVCPSVRPSVHPHGTTRLPLVGFSWHLIFVDFSKICRENSHLLTIGQE